MHYLISRCRALLCSPLSLAHPQALQLPPTQRLDKIMDIFRPSIQKLVRRENEPTAGAEIRWTLDGGIYSRPTDDDVLREYPHLAPVASELRAEIAELEEDRDAGKYWQDKYNKMGNLYLDMTQQYNDALADLEKLIAPPSEGEIEAVAKVIEASIMNARIWNAGDTPNWLEAKAAITKLLEMRS